MKRQKKISMQFTEKTINNGDIFHQRWTHYMMLGIIFIVISLLFYKVAFLKYSPNASDTLQWRRSAQQIIEYNKTHSETALWTDNTFSGMPTYLIDFPLKYPFLNNLFYTLHSLISWRILYLIFGAIGMYVLLVRKQFSPLVALFSALSFGLSCHFIGLIDIGHNTKLRAIMYIPWIFLCFDELRKNKNILSLGLLSIFLIDQLRVNHFQIAYYTYLMMFIYWVVYLVHYIKKKSIKNYIIFTAMAIGAICIAVISVANPYLSTYEYSHYSARGDTGLTYDYATSWSFGIWEVFSFIVPYVNGGVSPHYWGPMPFTQTFMYMGITVLYLAILASIFYFRKTKIKALVIITFVCLLISFGKHFSLLTKTLMVILPLFNMFRVPSMILAIVQFAIPVLAAYGLGLCIDSIKADNKTLKKTLLISLILAGILCVLFLNGKSLFTDISFTTKMEMERYKQAEIEHLRATRLELFTKSGVQSFGLLFLALLCLYSMVLGVVKRNVCLLILVVLTVADLSLINKNHLQDKDLVLEPTMTTIQTLETDSVLAIQDSTDPYRIFPFPETPDNQRWYQGFGNTRWSYYHQNIGGYHGAKLRRYNEILEHLHSSVIPRIPINWNIVNMLNVRYLIFPEKYDFSNHDFEWYHSEIIDRTRQYHTLLNKNALPRAWFVKNHEVVKNKDIVLKLYIDNPDFNPRDTVILESDTTPFEYSDDFTVNMTDRNIHYSRWETHTDAPAFLVVSEIYYPAGWNFYINGVKTEHQPANYILRGLPVPAGNNIIEMKFEPKTYRISVILSGIGLSLSVFLTLLGVFLYYRGNYGSGMVYKIGK